MPIGIGIGISNSFGSNSAGPNTAPSLPSSQTYTFVVPPGQAPTFRDMSPPLASTGRANNEPVTLNFNIPVTLGSAGFTIQARNATDNTLIKSYDPATDIGTGAGQVSIVNGSPVIRPPTTWPSGKRVSFRWTAGAVLNAGGIPVAANTSDSVAYFDVLGVIAQPSKVNTSTSAYGLTNLNPAIKSVVFAADLELPSVTGPLYFMSNGTIASRLTCESGRVRWQMRDSAGTVLFNVISSAVNLAFPSAGARKRLMALAYDDGTTVRFEAWIDGVSILSGSAARTANNWSTPTWWNATSGGGANALAFGIRGMFIGQASSLPSTLPTPASFWDASGNWIVPITGTVGGFASTFAEGGAASAYNARNGTDTFGTFTDDATVPAAITNFSLAATGVSGQIAVTIGTAPANGGASITDYRYRVNGGTITSFGSASIGTFNITATNEAVASVEVFATNSVGNSLPSAVKTETPYLAAAVTAIDATGWKATYPSPPTFTPDTSPERIKVSRAGYDATAASTTWIDRLVVTKRVRQPYPNQATLTASDVSLSDYVYSTDTISGVTNNSTEASPLPIANWAMISRVVVGNTLNLEIVAFHRDARNGHPVAAVEFRATDGTNTVTQVIGASSISGKSSDKNPLIVYKCALNITSLNDNAQITANAKVYPWIGNSSSVLDSANQSQEREFSPRIFTKNTTKFASPPIAYVTGAGNDSTGVVSTTASTAEATPFLTVTGAFKAFKSQSGVTGGILDGCELRVGSGSFGLGTIALASDVAMTAAAVTITRDPNVARANSVVTFGLAAWRSRIPYVVFRDISIVRTGTLALQGESAANMSIFMDDVNFDNGSNNAVILNSSHVYWLGATITNASASLFNAGTFEIRMIRGVSMSSPGTTVEGFLVLASNISGMSNVLTGGTRTMQGAIIFCNTFPSMTTGNSNGILNAGITALTGIVYSQNVCEVTSSTGATPGFRISADSAPGNITHAIVWHNTFTGYNQAGRANLFYDETTAALRTHKLLSLRGNIHTQINNKSDVFKLDGTRVGSWSYEHGVGCYGEFSMFLDAGGGGANGFQQDYPGLAAKIGTSASTRQDPLFTSYAGPTNDSGTGNGAGGGIYTLQTGSIAKGMQPRSCLSWDLTGAARAATSSAGAYE